MRISGSPDMIVDRSGAKRRNERVSPPVVPASESSNTTKANTAQRALVTSPGVDADGRNSRDSRDKSREPRGERISFSRESLETPVFAVDQQKLDVRSRNALNTYQSNQNQAQVVDNRIEVLTGIDTFA